MNIRNVQKTGKMHYLYLPTEWCKKHEVSSDTQLMISEENDGSLKISPQFREKTTKDLEITIKEENLDIVQKLIMACYINPVNSFRINLEKKLDFSKILQQKKLISLTMIEASGSTITGESNVSIENPFSLLLTMVKKTRNLIYLMTEENYDTELIERYEEEIDNSKSFIEKAVIAAFTYHRPSKLKPIETYYISLLSKDFERLADHLIVLDKKETPFIKNVLLVIDQIKGLLNALSSETPKESFNYKECMKLVKEIIGLGRIEEKDIESYHKNRVKAQLFSISEVLMDWSITLEIDD